MAGPKYIDLLNRRYTRDDTRKAGIILISIVRQKLPWKSHTIVRVQLPRGIFEHLKEARKDPAKDPCSNPVTKWI